MGYGFPRFLESIPAVLALPNRSFPRQEVTACRLLEGNRASPRYLCTPNSSQTPPSTVRRNVEGVSENFPDTSVMNYDYHATR